MDPLKALSPTVRKVVYPLVTLGAFVTAVLVAAAWAEGKVDTRAAAAVARELPRRITTAASAMALRFAKISKRGKL